MGGFGLIKANLQKSRLFYPCNCWAQGCVGEISCLLEKLLAVDVSKGRYSPAVARSPMIRFILIFLLLAIHTSSAGGKVPHSYQGHPEIAAAAAKLRKATAEAPSHSFSRAWFGWELLLRRYIDEDRKDTSALKMLAPISAARSLIALASSRPRARGMCIISFTLPWKEQRGRGLATGMCSREMFTVGADTGGGAPTLGWLSMKNWSCSRTFDLLSCSLLLRSSHCHYLQSRHTHRSWHR